MPFYDYKCTVCDYTFEELQGINEEPLKECPKCNKEVRKLIGLPARGQVEYGNARDLYENKIRPDAKRIADKINSGDQEEAANFFGEDKLFGK